MERNEKFYCHLGFVGIISEGYTSFEPDVGPMAFVGYGNSPMAAYTAARRDMLQRFRDREEAARLLTRERALMSKDGSWFPTKKRRRKEMDTGSATVPKNLPEEG